MNTLINLLLPLVSVIGLGVVVGKKTDCFSSQHISTLVSSVGIPCMMLHSILKMNMSIMTMGHLVISTLTYLLIMALVGYLLLTLLKQPVRHYLPVIVNPNTGNIGVPVCAALIGTQSVASALVISSVVQISHFTLGIGCYSGKITWHSLIRNMPVLALLFGAIISATDIKPGTAVMHTLDMVGGITIPLMLMQLGNTLSKLKIHNLKNVLKPISLAFVRVFLGFIVALVVVKLAPLESTEAAALLIQGTMPIAVLSYVLSLRYNKNSDDIAISILISIPLAIAVAYTAVLTDII